MRGHSLLLQLIIRPDWRTKAPIRLLLRFYTTPRPSLFKYLKSNALSPEIPQIQPLLSVFATPRPSQSLHTAKCQVLSLVSYVFLSFLFSLSFSLLWILQLGISRNKCPINLYCGILIRNKYPINLYWALYGLIDCYWLVYSLCKVNLNMQIKCMPLCLRETWMEQMKFSIL